jgi:hypothetical protein
MRQSDAGGNAIATAATEPIVTVQLKISPPKLKTSSDTPRFGITEREPNLAIKEGVEWLSQETCGQLIGEALILPSTAAIQPMVR